MRYVFAQPVTARVGIRRRCQHAYLVDVEIPNTEPLIGEIAEDLPGHGRLARRGSTAQPQHGQP